MMKSILDGFYNRLHIAEEKIYELEDSNKKNENWWVAIHLRKKHSELG